MQPVSKRRGITMAELLIGVGVLALAILLLCYAVHYQRGEARRIRCQGNLNQLAKGIWPYLKNYGDSRFYPWPVGRPGCGTAANPRFGGAEWLAALYWTKILPDPGCFICPASLDSNEDGRELGADGCPGNQPLPPSAVSYAGMGDRSVGIYMASKMGRARYATSRITVPDDFPPGVPMACDDTEEPINHGRAGNGGMNVLFFDSHVEWWTHERVDLERGVGTGELVHLRT